MVKIVKHIVSFLLAGIILFSTTGFTLSKHYCGNKLISVEINDKADDCCNGAMDNCCRTETTHYQMKEDAAVSAIQHILPVQEIQLLFPLVFHFVSLLPLEASISNTPYPNSSPPVLSTPNRLSLLQTYMC